MRLRQQQRAFSALQDAFTKESISIFLATLPETEQHRVYADEFEERCGELFHKLDRNRVGVLCDGQLQDAVQRCLSEKHCGFLLRGKPSYKELILVFDTNQDGMIDVAEFLDFARFVAAFRLHDCFGSPLARPMPSSALANSVVLLPKLAKTVWAQDAKTWSVAFDCIMSDVFDPARVDPEETISESTRRRLQGHVKGMPLFLPKCACARDGTQSEPLALPGIGVPDGTGSTGTAHSVGTPRSMVAHVGSFRTPRQHGLDVARSPRAARSLNKPRSCDLPHLSSSQYDRTCATMGILPKYSRVLRECLSDDAADLRSLALSDDQFLALLQDRDQLPAAQILQWRLRDNRLTELSIGPLVDKLPLFTRLLDLADNPLGPKAADTLGKHPLPQLQSLDLSGCGLANESAASLLISLRDAPLVRLELNRNQMSDGHSLGQLVGSARKLARLGLSSNWFTASGGAALFSGVKSNEKGAGCLANIDVSFNGFNEGDAIAFATVMADVLRTSSALFHLDLSYNRLDLEPCRIIAEGLKDNHFLFGLHFVGNAATMDSNGFLIPTKAAAAHDAGIVGGGLVAALRDGPRSPTASLSPRAAPTRLESSEDFLRERDPLEQQAMCWACDSWRLEELAWLIDPKKEPPKAVCVFTSMDDFHTGLRLRRVSDEKFSIWRMVPQGYVLQAIFQVDYFVEINPYMATKRLFEPVSIRPVLCDELLEAAPRPQSFDGDAVTQTAVVNIIQAAEPQVASLSELRSVLLDGPDGPVTMPRVTEREFMAKLGTEGRRGAAKGSPTFGNFRLDTEALMSACCDADWAHIKLDRLVKNVEERPKVCALCRRHYRKIIALYRHLSAQGVCGDGIFGVTAFDCKDLMQAVGLVDNAHELKVADVDRLFIASRVASRSSHKFEVRNDKCLVRFQFVELLIRIAGAAFLETKRVACMTDAVLKVLEALDGIFTERVDEFDSFIAASHTEFVDEVLRVNQEQLQAVFHKFSGVLAVPSKAPFMSLREWEKFLEAVNAYDESFKHNKAAIAYRWGLMTQADEYFTARFKKMSYVEFLHALAAAVFLKSGKAVVETMPKLLGEFFRQHLFTSLSDGDRAKNRRLMNKTRSIMHVITISPGAATVAP